MQFVRVLTGPLYLPLPAPALLVMVVVVVQLVMIVSVPGEALLFSGRRGQNRRLIGASPAETLSGVSQPRCQLACQQRSGCRSFNFHASSGVCEVFGVTACDGSGYVVQPADGWSWFDVVPDLAAESNQTLWRRQACVRDGRCRNSCLRQLEQGCRHKQQCGHLVSGGVQCDDYVCRCDANHWQYNVTFCLPKYPDLFTDGEYWVWKKIVNGMCSTDLKVKSAGSVEIAVFEAYTHYTKRYVFKISQTDVKGYRYVHGGSTKLFDSATKNLLSETKFIRINIQWCSGRVRLSVWSGGKDLISWNDPSPLKPTYLAIRSSPNTEGHWRFAENLVDPWFGEDWSATRVYSIPPNTLVLRRRIEQDFWVEFECRIARDCNWMARQQNTWHNANIWKVIIGGWSNQASEIRRHVTNVGWKHYSHTATPSILSAAEFRRFRIHFSPTEIGVYRSNETEPFMTHAVGAPFTINFDGPHMCCNEENVEYRLVQFDERWSYEGGFRWGENLVN